MIVRVLFALALILPAPAAAQSLEGSWALQMDGTTIFRFDLSQDADGRWQGTWSKPGSFASDGDHFRKLAGPIAQVPSMTATDLPDGVELSFDDPHPGAIPDIFDFRLLDPDAIRMTYVGTGLAPYTLQRVPADAPLGPWDPEKTYGRNDDTTKPGPVPEAPPAEAGPGSLPDNYQLPRGAPAGR